MLEKLFGTKEELMNSLLATIGIDRNQFVQFANGIGAAVQETRAAIQRIEDELKAQRSILMEIRQYAAKGQTIDLEDDALLLHPLTQSALATNAAVRARQDWQPGGANERLVDDHGFPKN
jgi:hypothetical protein